MAPKRSVKTVDLTNNNKNYNNLTLNDALCPICRSILIEPVTLPCNHGFCSSCFDGTVANANLVCPLCRIRIGSWLRRSSKKDNKLVNNVLWEAIKRLFPIQVQNKLAGNEEYIEEEVPRRLTDAGEIRREYEIQKAKELVELQKERDAESRASEEYIRKLKEKEEEEEKLRKKNIQLSEQIARKLAQEYTYDPGPSSSKTNSVLPKSSVNNKKQLSIDKALKKMNKSKVTITVKPIIENVPKKYTCKVLCQDQLKDLKRNESIQVKAVDKSKLLNWKIKDKLKKIITEGEASDSNDSITSECRYFKPIDQRFPSLSIKTPAVKVPAIVASANTVIIGPPKGEVNFKHALESAFALMKTSKVKNAVSTCTSQDIDLSNTVITELIQSAIERSPKPKEKKSPKKPVKNKAFEILNTSSSSKVSDISEESPTKGPERSRNFSGKFDTYGFVSPSKRKRVRSSPIIDVSTSKKSKLLKCVNERNYSPFLGFDNTNLNDLKRKTNGEITVEAIGFNPDSICKNNEITKLKQIQEEEDFKLAQRLHEELNSRGRYSTRNSISVHNNNVKKTSARQVTLKEMISASHTSNKVP